MIQKPFRVEYPKESCSSLVFACPHSGRNYNAEFLRQSVLDAHRIRSSEDAFVDMLFRDAPLYGAPLLVATTPRAYVDLNRSKDEYDPALVRGVQKQPTNPRIAAGLGVIPRVVANGQAIRTGKIHRHIADQRIRDHWQPYHDMLDHLLASARQKFGHSILIDCHSMPHDAAKNNFRFRKSRPDIILGDRHGSSAGGHIVEYIEQAFTRAGLVVVRNQPFAGAFITQHYGRPIWDRHAVQIEIDRALYMNEKSITPNRNFDAFQALISDVIADLVQIDGSTTALAAE